VENYIGWQKLVIVKRFSTAVLINIDCVECPHWRDCAAQEEIHRGTLYDFGCRPRRSHYISRVNMQLFSYRVFYKSQPFIFGWFEYFNNIDLNDTVTKIEMEKTRNLLQVQNSFDKKSYKNAEELKKLMDTQ